jgi:hypothetical protein
MQTSFDISNLPVFVRVRNSGLTEAGDLLAMWDELFSQDFWKPGTGILFDNRKINPVYTFKTAPEDVANLFGPDPTKIGAAHVAVLAPVTVNPAYSDKVQAIVNKLHAPVRLQYFFLEVNAVNWLRDAYKAKAIDPQPEAADDRVSEV